MTITHLLRPLFRLLPAPIRPLICGSVILIAATCAASAQTAQPAAPAASAPSATTPAAAGAVPPDVTAAQQLPAGPDQIKALIAATGNWAKTDPMAALTWALQLPPDQAIKVAPTFSGTCAKANGKATADFLQQTATPAAWVAMHPALLNWGLIDPASATAWALQTPPNIRFLAVFSTADGWARKDPAAASVWATKLENADDRRDAVQAVAQMWRGNLPAVTPWVQQLKGEDFKTAARMVAGAWRNPADVKSGFTQKQWLAQLGLSDADQDALLKSPPFPSMYPQDQKPAAKTN